MCSSDLGAILIYLAEKCELLLPVAPGPRTSVLQWLMFQMGAVGPMLGQFNHFKRYAPGDGYGLERYTTQARRIYDVLETRLGEVQWLGGDEYSIADIATFPWIRTESRMFGDRHKVLHVDWEGHPNLCQWYHQIAVRPAVRAAIAAFENRTSSLALVSARDLDLYFERGDFARSLDA